MNLVVSSYRFKLYGSANIYEYNDYAKFYDSDCEIFFVALFFVQLLLEGQAGEDLADDDWIGFEAIKRGVTSGRELGLAGLTAEILNGTVIAGVFAITGKGMGGWIGNAEVGAGRVRAEETIGRDIFLGPPMPLTCGQGIMMACGHSVGSVLKKKSSAASGTLIRGTGMHNSGLARSFVPGFFMGEEVLELFLFG